MENTQETFNVLITKNSTIFPILEKCNEINKIQRMITKKDYDSKLIGDLEIKKYELKAIKKIGKALENFNKALDRNDTIQLIVALSPILKTVYDKRIKYLQKKQVEILNDRYTKDSNEKSEE